MLSAKLLKEINSNNFMESSIQALILHITQILPQKR